MKARCYLCGKVAEGVKDKLLDEGWSGAEGGINGNRFKFEICPAHDKLGEEYVSIMTRIHEGKRVFRKKDGTYEGD